MSFQFCCPQGHFLQGEPEQIGHQLQCPYCGSSFVVPQPMVQPEMPGGYPQAPGQWPMSGMGDPSLFPPPGGMAPMIPGMPTGPAMPDMSTMPGMPMMPGQPITPAPGGPSFGMPSPQPFAFGMPPAGAGSAAGDATGASTPTSDPPHDAPGMILGFDPTAKRSLPFELPDLPPLKDGPAQGGPLSLDSLGNPPTSPEAAESLIDPQAGDLKEKPRAKTLHIPCPLGHVLKVRNDMLERTVRCPECKKEFELLYENSLEFKKRKNKILQRHVEKEGQAWLAWALLAAFIVIALVVVLFFAKG